MEEETTFKKVETRGRPTLQVTPPPRKFKKEYFDKKTGMKSIWHYDYDFFPNGPYKTEFEYTKEHTSFEEENAALPKTQRKYLTEKGKYVGYTRAKALGLVD